MWDAGARSGWIVAALLGLFLAVESPAAEEACDRIDVYSREGCPHCARAMEFLATLAAELPHLEVVVHDVIRDTAARTRLQELSAAHQVEAVGVPAFAICGTFIVGFVDAASTGTGIRNAVQPASARAAPSALQRFGAADVVPEQSETVWFGL